MKSPKKPGRPKFKNDRRDTRPAKNESQSTGRHSSRPRHEKGGKSGGDIEGTMIVLGRGGGVVKSLEYPDGIRVYEENMNTALHGDEVKVKIVGKRPARTQGGNPEIVGRITDILIRVKTEFTGVLVEEDGKYFLKASDPKMYTKIGILPRNIGDAKVGDRVYGIMEKWTDSRMVPLGKIIKVLGKPGEHETEMQAIALERGFTENFPEEVLAEAHEIDERGIQEEDLRGRRDFRKIVTFTIDPYDAKDFDDAISIEYMQNGDIEVGIHIADVSHYVRPKTHLDAEALERGTSVYLVDRTIPMLPRVLSDDLCSLLPHVDRLTMSAVVTFSPDGEEKSAWFGPTVIHSDHRFTYEEAQEVIDGKEHALRKEVMSAAMVARKLGKERIENGALVLEQEEAKVVIGKDGKVEKIVKKIRTESHTLIEELMLLANRRIAEFLERGGRPARKNTPPLNPLLGKGGEDAHGYAVLYRIHDQPSAEKAEDLAFFMRSIGHPLTLRKDGSIDPRMLGATLKKFEESDLKQTVLTYVVRSMAKAIYSTKNVGHYGLQFTHYAHFTSPIRRYPDLVIHRLLRYALAQKPAPANTRKAYERIARLTSMAEVRAADAERESVKLKLTEYMSERIGSILTGAITGIAEWGIYVRDKETTAEGLVSLRTVGDEPFRIDPKLATITGEITKRVFRIGDTIKVKVVRADPERRQIDYELAQ